MSDVSVGKSPQQTLNTVPVVTQAHVKMSASDIKEKGNPNMPLIFDPTLRHMSSDPWFEMLNELSRDNTVKATAALK